MTVVCQKPEMEEYRMKRMFSLLLALVFVLALTACGAKAESAPETTAAPTVPAADPSQPLTLTGWTMDATAWSSPNGATVNLTATPSGYTEGQSAVFTVRMDGEEVSSEPCTWDGSVYTASAELNALDGYCYFVTLTTSEGVASEITVNAPSAPTDETLINLADALNSFCTVTVNGSELADSKLTITDGAAQLQLPKLTLREGNVVCQEAKLILSYDDADVDTVTVSDVEADEAGLCAIDLAGTVFSIPSEMEDDHRLALRMEVQLSNGQLLSTAGGSWHVFDGSLVLAVG